jgi:hypothetical protein
MPSLDPRRRTFFAFALSATLLAPRVAPAHFLLRSPASWRVQNALGNPQKVGPCGDEGTAAATGAVTAFSPGETITLTLDETIFHPGHYRVALAVDDRGELPAEPPVTVGATACGSVPIMSPPLFPVLADGVLPHTNAFSGTRSIQVTLPSNVTCAHCTLQVLEFMSNHAAPCFYYHCADISIGTPSGDCDTDADCADDNLCTTDRCDPATSTCENVDTVTSTCDDGDACTRDACSSAAGCISEPIALAGVSTGFLGSLQEPPCSSAQVPGAIGTLFGKADTLVTRAAQDPAQAGRFLSRAAARLRRAAKKVTKPHGPRMSAECATALGTVLDRAQSLVRCLRSGD